jgi:hypothetical protein
MTSAQIRRCSVSTVSKCDGHYVWQALRFADVTFLRFRNVTVVQCNEHNIYDAAGRAQGRAAQRGGAHKTEMRHRGSVPVDTCVGTWYIDMQVPGTR